jgi:hypothetical protein
VTQAAGLGFVSWPLWGSKPVARTAGFVVHVFSSAILVTVSYSIAVSKLRRPLVYDRCLSVAVRRPRR